MSKKPAAPVHVAPAPDFIKCPAVDRAQLREVLHLALLAARDAEKSPNKWMFLKSDTAHDEAYMLDGQTDDAFQCCTIELTFPEGETTPSCRFGVSVNDAYYELIIPLSEETAPLDLGLPRDVIDTCEALLKGIDDLTPSPTCPDILGVDPAPWLEGLKALHCDAWKPASMMPVQKIALATPWTNIICDEPHPEPTKLAHFAKHAPAGVACEISVIENEDGCVETTATISHLYDALTYEALGRRLSDKPVYDPGRLTSEVQAALIPDQRLACELTSLEARVDIDDLEKYASHVLALSGRHDRQWKPAGKAGRWSCELTYFRGRGRFDEYTENQCSYTLCESIVDKDLCGVMLLWDEDFYLYAEVPIEFSGNPEALFLAYASTIHRFMKATTLPVSEIDPAIFGGDVRPWLTALALDNARTSGPNISTWKTIALPGPWTACSSISKHELAFPMHPETEAHFEAAGIRSARLEHAGDEGDIIEFVRHTADVPLPWLGKGNGPGALRAVQEAKQAGALPDHLL